MREHRHYRIGYIEQSGPDRKRFKGGGGSSEPTTQTSTTKQEPWAQQQPYIEKGFERSEDLYQTGGPDYFPDSTVTPVSAQRESALQAGEQRAMSGNPLLPAAQQQQFNTIQGQYTDPASNPFYKDLVDSTTAAVRPGIDSMFARGGRAGSGAHAERLGQGIGSAMGPQLFADYGRERALQQDAAQTAPSLAQQDYFDIDQLGQIGQAREQKSTENLQDTINRYNFGQNQEAANLNQYLQQIGGSYGGTTTQEATTQQPSYGGK